MKGFIRNRERSKRSFFANAVPFLLLIIGVSVMAYPSFSDWWNSRHQSKAIDSYVTVVDTETEEKLSAIKLAAEEYNLSILNKNNVYIMSEEDKERYNSLLDPTGNGIMGYVQIDSIGVNLPIYHGTQENILQMAIGHIEWSSLPVGGTSTHTVLSGHRGLPRAKLFTDLDRLKIGDIFTITVLKDTLTYVVDKITIVDPEDTTELTVREGLDLCTLVTCTPYGINTHRLLVRGHRIENVAPDISVSNGASRVSNIIVFMCVFVPLLFLLLVGLLAADYADYGIIPDY